MRRDMRRRMRSGVDEGYIENNILFLVGLAVWVYFLIFVLNPFLASKGSC